MLSLKHSDWLFNNFQPIRTAKNDGSVNLRRNFCLIRPAPCFEQSLRTLASAQSNRCKDSNVEHSIDAMTSVASSMVNAAQCDQMARLFFNIWPFSTMKICFLP